MKKPTQYFEFAKSAIDLFIEDKSSDLGLSPQLRGMDLIISTHGISNWMLESKDSTMLLDLDETLLHSLKMSPETLNFLIKNPTNPLIQPDKNSLNKAALKEFAIRNVDKFKKAIDNNKYKENMFIVQHPVLGYQIILFRPRLKEFLNGLEELTNSKDLKDVQVFTANIQSWAQTLTETLNEYADKKLSLWKIGNDLDADSLIVDDHKGSALIKLHRTNIIDIKNQPKSLPWVPVSSFVGNMHDTSLLNTLKDIKQRL